MKQSCTNTNVGSNFNVTCRCPRRASTPEGLQGLWNQSPSKKPSCFFDTFGICSHTKIIALPMPAIPQGYRLQAPPSLLSQTAQTPARARFRISAPANSPRGLRRLTPKSAMLFSFLRKSCADSITPQSIHARSQGTEGQGVVHGAVVVVREILRKGSHEQTEVAVAARGSSSRHAKLRLP